MDSDLKSELAEHQTLQDAIIKKIRDSIKKQETRENPFKLFRCKIHVAMFKGENYIDLDKIFFAHIHEGAIEIQYSAKDDGLTIMKSCQKDDDYQKMVDYITRKSVNISELVNNWDKYLHQLRDKYLYIPVGNTYIKLSYMSHIKLFEDFDPYTLVIGYCISVCYILPNNPIIQDLKKLFELLAR